MGPSPTPKNCLPSFDLESEMMDRHGLPVAGIDEAGRGPWAGPVVVAAVILDAHRIPDGLNDSKKLKPEAREDRYEEIMANSRVAIAIGHVGRIDRDNILQATFWGMRASFRDLKTLEATALIDGNLIPKRFPGTARAIIGGDGISLSIAAASIVAKVTRDRIMVRLAKRYGCYGWESNKGYGTKEHVNGIERHGICPHHRRSFAPIRRILASQQNLAPAEN